MRGNDYTEMGGTRQAFPTTHWSFIEDTGSDDPDKNRVLIGLLLQRYWKPVYCYLRRRGYGNEQAKDLTQGFFHQVVLTRDLAGKADRSKGRFRSFLLMALKRYVIDVENKKAARKRIPEDRLVRLDEMYPPELPQKVVESSPEDSFHYAWVSALLEQVLEEVEAACREDGKSLHWQIFHERVVQPITDGAEPPSLKELCDRHGLEDDARASNMIVTVKRRFQTALRKHLRDSVASSEQVNGELEELRRFFPRMAQGSR